jgi:ribosomal protein S18 acetylase RimI-like enzyme
VRKATDIDIPDIDALFCSEADSIGLTADFCADENRERRVTEYLGSRCESGSIWVVRDGEFLAGFMIMDRDLFGHFMGICYLVVARHVQGSRTVGPALVQKAQAMAGELAAEARNERSKRLLEKAGFGETGESSPSGHPKLRWVADDPRGPASSS